MPRSPPRPAADGARRAHAAACPARRRARVARSDRAASRSRSTRWCGAARRPRSASRAGSRAGDVRARLRALPRFDPIGSREAVDLDPDDRDARRAQRIAPARCRRARRSSRSRSTESADHELERKRLGGAIAAGMAALDDEQRAVLVLREYHELDYAEIATALDARARHREVAAVARTRCAACASRDRDAGAGRPSWMMDLDLSVQLAAWAAPPAPLNLADRVIARATATDEAIKVVDPAPPRRATVVDRRWARSRDRWAPRSHCSSSRAAPPPTVMRRRAASSRRRGPSNSRCPARSRRLLPAPSSPGRRAMARFTSSTTAARRPGGSAIATSSSMSVPWRHRSKLRTQPFAWRPI